MAVRNLGTISALIRGDNPPLNANGTPKKEVLWVKTFSGEDRVVLHYYDDTIASWVSFKTMKDDITAINTALTELQTNHTNLVTRVATLEQNSGDIADRREW